MMTTLATLIRRAELAEAARDYTSISADALRAASKRVRITQVGEQLIVTVDGEERYQTDGRGCGLWHYSHRADDGAWRDGNGRYTPVQSWHQIIGTGQISGRYEVRAYVVEAVATDAAYDEKETIK